MDARHEQVAVAAVQDRLEEQFPALDPAVVEAAVRLAHTQMTDSPIRDFVPVLVEHAARTGSPSPTANATWRRR